ncbi:MAG: DNA methyltransferase [Vulcanibacillus sp.]
MPMIIHSIKEAIEYEIDKIEIDVYWNSSLCSEHKMHSIHAYPAKFPAFIASKAIEKARLSGIDVNTISDVFCGCGTVALEAKLKGINFWGCDINPVATLITKAKTYSYNTDTLIKYFRKINKTYTKSKIDANFENANMRLQYWFNKDQYIDLYRLKKSIESIPEGKYKTAFECLFSSILKKTSKWLAKSIKPQIDPLKKPANVWDVFNKQYAIFLNYILEIPLAQSNISINTCNILEIKNTPKVDLIITSPPYVTSYEYADLHQLSSLWLNYASDFRSLRKNSIGSAYQRDFDNYDLQQLNHTASSIINDLQQNKCINKRRIMSIIRYYIDMQKVATQCYKMLNSFGMAVFVVGDTEYKGTKIYNSKHLVESLIQSGFYEVSVSKRKISNKILTPYRDENGKFSNDKTKRKIYHEEFVIIGRKK